jgi:hypothetical protein
MRAEMTKTTEATKATLLSTMLATLQSINPGALAMRYWPALALLGVLVLALAGYAYWPRTTAPAATATTAVATPSWSRVCVAGVSYLQFPSGVSVEWTAAGRVKTCTETK